MNELRLQSELYTSEDLHASAVEDNVYLVSALYVDGIPVANFRDDYAAFLQELMQSTVASGNYDILTCWCGSPECAGIYQAVRVIHEGDVIKWLWSQPEPKRTYIFDSIAYKQAIESGIEQITREVRDLWVPGVEADKQQLKIVPNLDAPLLEPKVRHKTKRRQ